MYVDILLCDVWMLLNYVCYCVMYVDVTVLLCDVLMLQCDICCCVMYIVAV